MFALAVGLGAATLAGAWWSRSGSSSDDIAPARDFPWASAASDAYGMGAFAPLADASSIVMPPTAAGAEAASTGHEGPVITSGQGVFRVDADGRLVVDQAMRERLEALLALHGDDSARIASELASLPAPAAARARELMAQFESYQGAQRAAFPPAQAPLVPEEGLAQLDALQALRATHFGAEPARRMFEQDDAVARRLLELMREDRGTGLSMAEKAMRAQARFDSERGGVKP